MKQVFFFLLLSGAAAPPEREVADQVNAHRLAAGLAELAWHEAAAAEARSLCERLLARQAARPHDGFEGRARRLRRTSGARRAGENVFLMENGRFQAERALEAWLASESHRRTLEGPFDRAGVGVVIQGRRACAAQIFLGR